MTALRVLGESGPAAGAQFEALYRSCASDLYGYVASIVRDRAAAEDVTALVAVRDRAQRGA